METKPLVKEFTELTPEERTRLHELTIEGRSTFRAWLAGDPEGRYASMVSREGKVVGWAGADISPAGDVIGAYVDRGYRKQGIAREAVDALLGHIVSHGVQPNFFWYEKRASGLFEPALQNHGIGDHHHIWNEKIERRRRTSPKKYTPQPVRNNII